MSAVVAATGTRLSPEARAWVTQATRFSRIAGPDGDAVHLEDRCGLGHAWLRTSPLEVAQPMSLDGRIWVTADVRLDGRADLIADLRARGRHVLITVSDAEVVLHAYAVWGQQCLEHLEGDFAFALWDGPRQVLMCARDQLGVIPLHYARIPGGMLVASATDALMLHPAVSDDLDESALADFVLTGVYRDFAATAFKGIRRLPPGHAMVWSPGRERLWQYWRLPRWDPLIRLPQPRDYVERFRELFDAAVADRITTDRLAVQLSGGMDSSSIAASAQAALATRGAPPEALRAMTAVLGGASGDREGEFAALVAQALGIQVDWIDGSTMPADDPHSRPLLVTPEPTPYRATAFEYETARRPSQHAPVTLSGIAGDALLWFSPWYWSEWLAHGRVLRLARAYGDHFHLFGARPHPHLPAIPKYVWSRRVGGRQPLPAWLDPDFAARIGARQRQTPPTPRAADLDVRSLAGKPLWSTMCTWGDPSFTRLPIRFRCPFLDLRLLRFTGALPPEPWLINKRILRDATVDRLPAAIRGRPKAPLVDAPRPGQSPADCGRLRAFVRDAPGLDRFVDREALVSAMTDAHDSTARRADDALVLPLGLAHWLVHWSRPHPRRDLGPGAGTDPLTV